MSDPDDLLEVECPLCDGEGIVDYYVSGVDYRDGSPNRALANVPAVPRLRNGVGRESCRPLSRKSWKRPTTRQRSLMTSPCGTQRIDQ